MSEINTFKELDNLVEEARNFFHTNLDQSQSELKEIFFHCFRVLKSISKFYKPEEWENSRQEYTLSVLMQSLETILAMYYLTESGFWDNALVLKRNYVELLSIAIAIGYDNQCFIDWKNNRDCINSFSKISKRIEESDVIPEIEKKLLPLLKKYWNETSQSYSHNIGLKSIRTLVKSGQIKFEPKTAKSDFQTKRLRTFRNMLLNILSLILGIFKYGEVTESRKTEFPEALDIINHSNIFFQNENWRSQETT